MGNAIMVITVSLVTIVGIYILIGEYNSNQAKMQCLAKASNPIVCRNIQ